MTQLGTVSTAIRLHELPARVCGVVRELDTDDEDIQRLKTLGICVGRQVEIIKRGDPLIVRVFGSRLGISAPLARRVLVEPCVAGCTCPLPPAKV